MTVNLNIEFDITNNSIDHFIYPGLDTKIDTNFEAEFRMACNVLATIKMIAKGTDDIFQEDTIKKINKYEKQFMKIYYPFIKKEMDKLLK